MTDIELKKIIAGVTAAMQTTPVVDSISKEEVEVLLLKQEIELLKQIQTTKDTTTTPDNGLDINKLLSYKMLSGIF